MSVKKVLLRDRKTLVHELMAHCCRYRCFSELLATLCARDIKRAAYNQGIGEQDCVLVIKHSRFRGDIDMLRESGSIAFLKLPTIWPGRFYRWFYGSGDVHQAYRSEKVRKDQERYRRFLETFLMRLSIKLRIRALLSSGVNYKIAVDWVAVSDSLRIPSVVFHREGYMGSIHERNHLRSFSQYGRRFEGTKLVLQTEVQRKVLTDGEFVRCDKSAAIGTLRFDCLFERGLPNQQPDSCTREWVTFFSFGVSTGFLSADPPPYWPRENESNYLYQFSKMSHIAVAKFAASNPDVKVMIKTKWAKRWFEKVHEFLDSASLSADLIPNLIVTDQVDSVPAQISRSRVVVGYGSTTLLEAAITGIPVIMPFFSEIAKEEFSQYVCFPDIFHCFEIAESPDDLSGLIRDRYNNWAPVNEDMMRFRIQAFEKYISPCDGESTKRAEKILEEIMS